MDKVYYLDEKVGAQRKTWRLASKFLKGFIKNDVVVNSLFSVLKKSETSFRIFFLAIYIYKKSLKRYVISEYSKKSSLKEKVLNLEYTNKADEEAVIKNSYLLFIVSLMISSKILEDHVYTNQCWASMCCISNYDINLAEKCVLGLLNWEVEPEGDEILSLIQEFEVVNGKLRCLIISRKVFIKNIFLQFFYWILSLIKIRSSVLHEI